KPPKESSSGVSHTWWYVSHSGEFAQTRATTVAISSTIPPDDSVRTKRWKGRRKRSIGVSGSTCIGGRVIDSGRVDPGPPGPQGAGAPAQVNPDGDPGKTPKAGNTSASDQLRLQHRHRLAREQH